MTYLMQPAAVCVMNADFNKEMSEKDGLGTMETENKKLISDRSGG
jgi:hypothetical protein